MSRFLSTYSSDFIPPECEEDNAPEVSLPSKRCKVCPDPTGSRRPSCSSNTSCVRSIKQIDYTIVPQIRSCRCTCQCCLSQKPERAKEPCKPATPLPMCPPPPARPGTEKCCCRKLPVREDPCCRLHKIRMAQAIDQDPDCYRPVCQCKPKACPVCRDSKQPNPCNSCRVRNDDPEMRHTKSRTTFVDREETGGCEDDENGSCSRNPSKLRFDVQFSSKQN
ncbi:uncharacterized protein LOC131431132 [Malaya genurostris]|uniref:uncharacterized protein LOC131431132 n=1 Tax=Malaya genurostris TaxID=325434 RepID=UPI0026F3D5C1|nr:uncharacterized protein LOC131431132 [Malaya genurostris]